MELSILFLCSFLLGAVPFGLIIGKLAKGIDIRQYGSGNIGTTNVIRIFGPVWGSIVFVLDVLKGFVPTYIALKLNLSSDWFVVLAGALAVFGHTFSPFLKFKGGKGVATSLGLIIGLSPIISAITFGIFIFVLFVSKYVSLSSCIATISVFFMMLLWKNMDIPVSFQIVVGILTLAIILKHIPNFKRIVSKTEPKIGQRIKID